METFQIIFTIVLMIVYTIFSAWAVTKFRKLSTGIAGSLCLAAGSVGVYVVAPMLATVLVWLVKGAVIIGLICLVICAWGE